MNSNEMFNTLYMMFKHLIESEEYYKECGDKNTCDYASAQIHSLIVEFIKLNIVE